MKIYTVNTRRIIVPNYMRNSIVFHTYVKNGDYVVKGERICEIASNRNEYTLTSEFSGTVHQLHISKYSVIRPNQEIGTIEVEESINDMISCKKE